MICVCTGKRFENGAQPYAMRDRKYQLSRNTKSRHYGEAYNEWWGHLRDLAPGQHGSKETLKRWRAVGDTVPNLTDP